MSKKTPFYAQHLQSNAKIVDFAGWDMPLHYGSQLQEHHKVRNEAGMFDVSHMGVVDLKGPQVTAYLRYLLANDVQKLVPGKALYTCMLTMQGGVIDDLIVYKITDEYYRLVINAGTRHKDLEWMRSQAVNFDVIISELTDVTILALQGPQAKNFIASILSATDLHAIQNLKPFHFARISENDEQNLFIARTGYTGEDGFEIIAPAAQGKIFWEKLLEAGVSPCGLGSRDTLRLEAGMNLYGLDMDEKVTPLESALTWTVAFEPSDRDFIGRKVLEELKANGIENRMIGLVLEGPGIIRNHQKIFIGDQEIGEVTSGGYAPTLEKSIALARVKSNGLEACEIEIRNKKIPAKVVKLPFVRNGKQMF